MNPNDKLWCVVSAERYHWHPGRFKMNWNLEFPQEHKVIQIGEHNVQLSKIGHISKEEICVIPHVEVNIEDIPDEHSLVAFTDRATAILYMRFSRYVNKERGW